MTEIVGILAWGLLPLLLFTVSLLCFSLTEFSRSTLEEISDERGNLDRFRDIMRDRERARLTSMVVWLALLLITCGVSVTSPAFAYFLPPAELSVATLTPWMIRTLGVAIGIFLLLIGGPWTISHVCGERVLFRLWPLVEMLSILCLPVWTMFNSLDRLVHRVSGVPEPSSAESTMQLTEELRSVVDEGHRSGILQKNASRMIHRVVDLQSEDVSAIMTPRTDMVTIPASTLLAAALPQMVEQGYSRIPVVGRTVDDVVGILYARDLLAASVSLQSELNTRTVDSISREVFFVPESQGIENLLEKMQQQKVHMAIVVDEYSGVSGLVTLEDIIEEIVGDISDEYDEEQQSLITKTGDGTAVVDARFHIDDLNREMGLELPEDEDFDTVGGFLMSVRGLIPVQGEIIESHGAEFHVLEGDERRLKRLQIVVKADADATTEGDTPDGAG